jgi:hypothetical protein
MLNGSDGTVAVTVAAYRNAHWPSRYSSSFLPGAQLAGWPANCKPAASDEKVLERAPACREEMRSGIHRAQSGLFFGVRVDWPRVVAVDQQLVFAVVDEFV